MTEELDIVRERILRRLEELNLSPNAVSREAGLDRSVLRKFLNGTVYELRDRNIRKIADALKVDHRWLRGDDSTMQQPVQPEAIRMPMPQLPPPTQAGVPVIGVVEAGAWRRVDYFNQSDLGVVENGFDPHFPQDEQFAYRVRGAMMDQAGISDGDSIICIDPWKTGVEIGHGDFVVVEIDDSSGQTRELTVKELVLDRTEWLLAPRTEDPRQEPISVPVNTDLSQGSVRVVALVTSVIRRLQIKLSATRNARPSNNRTRSARRTNGSGNTIHTRREAEA